MVFDKKFIMKSDKYVKRAKIVLIVVFAVLLCVIQLISMIKGNGLEKYIITEEVVVKHNGKKVFEGNIDILIEKSDKRMYSYKEKQKKSLI
jgi:murein L,D-transpeptidase YafK